MMKFNEQTKYIQNTYCKIMIKTSGKLDIDSTLEHAITINNTCSGKSLQNTPHVHAVKLQLCGIDYYVY